MKDYIYDVCTKIDGITVRVWDTECNTRPMAGHYNFKFTWEEAPNIAAAKKLADNWLRVYYVSPPSSSTIFL